MTRTEIFGLIKTKFALDSLANFISVLLLGLFGLVFNMMVITKYDAGVLGLFHIVFALNVVFVLIATGGVPFSVLKYAAQFSEDQSQIRTIFFSGLAASGLLASLFLVLLIIGRKVIADAFKSPDLFTALLFALPAFWFGALNVYLLKFINGLRKMRPYALMTTAKRVVLIVALFVAAGINLAGSKLSAVLSIGEIVLFGLLFIYSLKQCPSRSLGQFGPWMRRHVSFGSKSLIGSAVTDMNAHLQVLLLGLFLSDWHVGIFTFISTVVDGVMQLPLVLRLNMDPVIVRLIAEKRKEEISHIVKKSRFWLGGGMLLIGGALMVILPYLTRYGKIANEYGIARCVFILLMAGAILKSTYVPFGNILIQSDYPGLHTVFALCVTFTGLLLNIMLIPLWGICGSALASCLTSILFIVYLKRLTRHALKIRI